MRPLLVLAFVGVALFAASTEAAAVGVEACLGRQCVGFHPLPTLLADLPPISIDTPLGPLWVVPCV